MNALHEAVARAIADCDYPPGTRPPATARVARIDVAECAEAAVRVCLAEAQRAIEALPTEGRFPTTGERFTYSASEIRDAALAALAALVEDAA